MKIDIKHIRCVFCGHSPLNIYVDLPTCSHCGHEFPTFHGINFLGSYNTDDTLGLIEITSKLGWAEQKVSKRRESIEAVETKFSEQFSETDIYDINRAASKNHIVGSNKMGKSRRLRQWATFELLAKKLMFNNSLCLDIGAGSGSDSMRLIKRGAEVVCLDYNPMSIKLGSLVVDEAQWFGGNSEALPFVTNTFDFTMANAALHHMHDFIECINEMYRVTKPGGFILLISDPFAKSSLTVQEHEARELRVFDMHPMVLNGVNEGLLPIDEYLEIVEKLDQNATILTMKIHDDSEISNTPTYWTPNQETVEYLETRSGNISSLIEVGSRDLQAPIKDVGEIPTKEFLQCVGNPTEAINFLLPYLPIDFFDTFPFKAPSKFLLMNGWHASQDFNSYWRAGYNRVRLFLTKDYLIDVSNILVKIINPQKSITTKMYAMINSVIFTRFTIENGEYSTLSLGFINSMLDKNVIEIGIADTEENKGAIFKPYDIKKCFAVLVER